MPFFETEVDANVDMFFCIYIWMLRETLPYQKCSFLNIVVDANTWMHVDEPIPAA